jgi:alternate signal-mediated exported protein
MKKSTKGALAAGAAGVLLLGGAGSLAYWSDSSKLTGTIKSGHLKLVDQDCGTGWKFDDGFAFANQKVVPGDSVTQTCTYKVDLAGTHLKAVLEVEDPEFVDAMGVLESALDATADFTLNDTTPATVVDPGTPVQLNDGDTIKAVVEVKFPESGLPEQGANGLGGLTAVLDAIIITAKQSHEVPAPLPPVDTDPVQ